MFGTRAALACFCVVLGSLGCVSAPPAVRWSSDLVAAKARAKVAPDRLVVVRFIRPDRLRPDAREPAVDSTAAVRARLAGHESVRLLATEYSRLFRTVFDAAPGEAVCVMDCRGLVVAARLGPVPPLEFAALVRQAEVAYPLVAALAAELKSLPASGTRAARREKTFLLAEALLLSGNPHAAYRRFMLVTLLPPRGGDGWREVRRAWARLARIEIDRGRYREAREWLGQLREADPDGTAHRSEVRLTEAMIAMAERRVQDARAILVTLQADDSNAEADRVWFEYGRACQQAGHDADARRAFATVVDRYPESPWRSAAAAVLAPDSDGKSRPRR